MYEELVKRLRAVVDGGREEKCDGCPYEEDYPCCVDCLDKLHKQAADAIENTSKAYQMMAEAYEAEVAKSRWIPVTEALPSDFVSVQAHMTDAGDFPSVREAYVVNNNWFFPALEEFYPVDMWKQFDEPPKEDEDDV